MEIRNRTEFLLLGLTEDPELQPLIFNLFLSMYLVTILGKLLIILAIYSDSHLHTPMYFFLCSLSLNDICFITSTIPKMLLNIQTQDQSITYTGCLPSLPSSEGKHKAFFTCEFHLSVVSLFCGTAFGVYIRAAVIDSPGKTAVASVMYIVISPMLNCFIYSLRNRDMKETERNLISRLASLL
ncbi:Olfactory receptor 7G2 [Sciurus carolinensis]|uniref:Olfactory receptor 7G2 n=1 Tax=Sciurus carolinensis TaxID=30640 RepID=A0AA41MXA5_SCICA|nr:Olfactory receptor 7G2 [Sciurus carolinensis]